MGGIFDRDLRGIEYVDKPFTRVGASLFSPNLNSVPPVEIFEDFDGDTLNLDKWVITSNRGAGAGASDFAISTAAGDPVAAHGGWISGTTANIDDGDEEFAGELTWRADRAGNGLLVFETRISLPSITDIGINAGLSDAKSETGIAVAVGAAQALTTVATDAAVWVFDTDATTDVFYGVNVDTDVDGTIVTGIAPVASTAIRLRIEILSNGNCYYYQDGAFKGSDATGVTETIPLAPYFAVVNRAASVNKSLEIDYCYVGCAR